ncbi:YppE family protein [Bacillus sp. 03113]|uniref:YppE family protein n=1 Tax=Bacillus sp. 03113 TaxID=2578211 RepID=UPI0011442134|nr:YppE family protein [Bacillus sp. 03113]
MKKDLLELTKELMTYSIEVMHTFENVKASGQAADFFTVVKPFADKVKLVNDKWKEKVYIWINKDNPKHIHMEQIESTYNHMELISIQAFFPETSRTRFINYVKSVQFILETIILDLKRSE